MANSLKSKPGKASTEKRDADVSALGPEITADELCALTGLTDRRHRQLASDGYFPEPKRGRYQTRKTLQGLFRFMLDRSNRKGSIDAAKLKKIEEEARLLEIERQEREGLLVSKAACDQANKKFYAIIMQGIDQKFGQELPSLAVSLDEVGIHGVVMRKKKEFMDAARAALRLESKKAARAAGEEE